MTSHPFDESPNLSELHTELRSLNERLPQAHRFSWSSIAVTGILTVLTLMTVVQTVQARAILGKVAAGSPVVASPTTAQALPSNVSNLPNMVGGC